MKSTDWVEVTDLCSKREEWDFGIEKIWWDQYYADKNAEAQVTDMIFRLDMRRVHLAAESFFKMLFELRRSFVGIDPFINAIRIIRLSKPFEVKALAYISFIANELHRLKSKEPSSKDFGYCLYASIICQICVDLGRKAAF